MMMEVIRGLQNLSLTMVSIENVACILLLLYSILLQCFACGQSLHLHVQPVNILYIHT